MQTHEFTKTGRAVLTSLVPVICPPQYVRFAAGIIESVALTISGGPALVRRGLDAGLVGYDLGAVPFYGKRARSLTGARAEQYFSAWEHGPTPLQFQLARALNQLLSMACYEQPEVMSEIGYHVAPWIEESRAKRLTVFRDEIRAQDERLLAPDPLRPGVNVARARRQGRG